MDFIVAQSIAGENAERNRGQRRPRGERQLGLAQPPRHGHAFLALAGSGAEAGVALHLLEIAVAERKGVLEIGQRHVLAAADDDLHDAIPRARAAPAPTRAPSSAAASTPRKPATSPQANTRATRVRPSPSTWQAKPPASSRNSTAAPCCRGSSDAGAGSAATATRSQSMRRGLDSPGSSTSTAFTHEWPRAAISRLAAPSIRITWLAVASSAPASAPA